MIVNQWTVAIAGVTGHLPAVAVSTHNTAVATTPRACISADTTRATTQIVMHLIICKTLNTPRAATAARMLPITTTASAVNDGGTTTGYAIDSATPHARLASCISEYPLCVENYD